MSGIRSIAVAGASGNLGPHVVKALIDANFEVTVLTRSKKPDSYSDKVKIIEVDFTSVDSLTAALKGIDAIVSTVGSQASDGQTVLIDAAVAAGVKRFIPSEFGSVTTNPKLVGFPIYASMFRIKQYLQGKADTGVLSWTVLACGAFLEFAVGSPMFVDFANHKAALYDVGDNRFSATALPSVGKAIAEIFKNPEATENRVVRVSEVILTQNRILRVAQELKPDAKWELSNIQTSAVLQEGLDGVSSGNFTEAIIMKVLLGTVAAGDVYGAAFDETDNELLGVKELSDADLKSLIAGKLV